MYAMSRTLDTLFALGCYACVAFSLIVIVSIVTRTSVGWSLNPYHQRFGRRHNMLLLGRWRLVFERG